MTVTSRKCWLHPFLGPGHLSNSLRTNRETQRERRDPLLRDDNRAQPPPTNKEERRDPLLRDDNRAQSPPNAREERRDPLLRDDNLVQSPPNAKEERRDEAQDPPKAKEEPPQGAGARFFGAIGLRGIQKRLSWRPL